MLRPRLLVHTWSHNTSQLTNNKLNGLQIKLRPLLISITATTDQNYALEKHDADILMSETVWLTNTIIAASQSVLKSMIPAGQTLLFKTGELIQILHCCSENWLTVSIVAAQHLPEVSAPDSLYQCCSTSKSLPYCIATSSNEISLNYVDVQMQSWTYDCWLFAFLLEEVSFQDKILIGGPKL